MKKVMIISFFAFLLIGAILVTAANDSSKGIGKNVSQAVREKREEFKSGNYTTNQGQFLNVKEIVAGLKELREDNVSVKTELKLAKVKDTETNKTELEAEMSDGSNKTIKIMPVTASSKAIEVLRLKVCNESNNCTIELKEVGNKVAYEVQIERHYKLLALFKAKAINKAEVDAETGEVTVTKKPWWAFLAAEQD